MPKLAVLKLSPASDGLRFSAAHWPGFAIGPAVCHFTVDGKKRRPALVSRRARRDRIELVWRAGAMELAQVWTRETPARWRGRSELRHRGTRAATLNAVTLLESARFIPGATPADVRILEQTGYLGHVRTPRQMATGSDGFAAMDGTAAAFVSSAVMAAWNPADRRALLAGFETFARWHGKVKGFLRVSPRQAQAVADNVDGSTYVAPPAARAWLPAEKVPPFRRFALEFDGGDLRVDPGETVALEEIAVALGDDPHALLEDYAARTAARHGVRELPAPFANWCSWYPYRLGVTEERVLANARAARARGLDRLGLRFIQADLGWEKDNIPTYFEENGRFAHGLGWLAKKLRAEGFGLGAWNGALCVCASHPVAREHREWLLRDARGQLPGLGNWFWEPHEKLYALDLTHPGAQAWLRAGIGSLARRGVRYFKWDFANYPVNPALRGRHDPKMVCGGGLEGLRRAFAIAQAAMNSAGGAEGFVLDCTAHDQAALGSAKLSYSNYDTGNSGLGCEHLRRVYTAFACHLFKQHRWFLLQPSCLVAGLPGTLEEARIRATATFMGAGHVDISDDLTTLPEERWAVLLSALPPNPTPARAADLFEPVRMKSFPYLHWITGAGAAGEWAPDEPRGACVWTLPVRTDWDDWRLVAVFNWWEPEREAPSRVPLPRRFQIGFAQLGLPPAAKVWGYEFWSGQFLGALPEAAWPAGAYRHPGDAQKLALDAAPGVLDVAFTGPAVKLFVLRRPRRHPWPVGTSFHQSGGRELANVAWDAARRSLRGELRRPAGQNGFIMIAGARSAARPRAWVAGRPAPLEAAANGAWRLPITATADKTPWRVSFA